MAEPTDSRLMRPAAVNGGRGQLLSATGQNQTAGRGGAVADGMIAVSTCCNAILDASENKWFPGVEPLL